MSLPYAEVIGDPVAQSKSPLIHNHWLERLNIVGDYRKQPVEARQLADFLRDRRSDPNWRGCNVTIPHKEVVLAHVDEIESAAAAIGAVNCVVAVPTGLLGYNTDIDGIAAGLGKTHLAGEKVAIIGGGGAARAALAYLASREVDEIVLLVREPRKAEPLRPLAPHAMLTIGTLSDAADLLSGASAILNASPLGMAGCAEMPPEVLSAVASQREAALFDMVYNPVETKFLAAGSGPRIDGLTMLVGQAARAFELFFGAPAPPPDATLRALLTAD